MSRPIYVVLDTETTGLDVNTAGIISFSYIITDFETEYERGTIEMNPFESESDIENASEALKINGYTPEKIATFDSARVGMARIADVFQRATLLGDGLWPRVMGYNIVAYDMPIIKNNAKKYGITLPDIRHDYLDVLQGIRMLDVMGVIPVRFKEDGKPMGNRLYEAVQRLEIESEQDKFHGSMYDTEMTLKIFKTLAEKLNNN